MPTSSNDFIAFLGTQIGYSWLWGLAVTSALFLFALGAAAIRYGIRSVLRHVRGLFHL